MDEYFFQRFDEFLEAYDLNANKLSVILGKQNMSITNIKNRKTKPGFDTMNKIFAAFPDLNPEWFITGRGEMRKKNITGDHNKYTQQDNTGHMMVMEDGSEYKKILKEKDELIRTLKNQIIHLQEEIKFLRQLIKK